MIPPQVKPSLPIGLKPIFILRNPNLTAVKYGNITIEVQDLGRGDICALQKDAIVNAANGHLAPGAGVCGAIHAGGGHTIFEECDRVLQKRHLSYVSEGTAVITHGGKLKAPYVIHAVGPCCNPQMNAQELNEASIKLYSAYSNSLALASENQLTSIAFPSISTGIFNFPLQEASQIAIHALRNFAVLNQGSSLKTITLAVWSAPFLEYNPRLIEVAQSDGAQ